MPISDWFKAREQRHYTTPTQTAAPSDVPDGVWVRCEGCKRTLYMGDLERELMVCPTCGRHHDLSAPERLAILVDSESAEPADLELHNLTTVATLITHAAWLRTESRGCHSRVDFPERDDVHWRGRTVMRRGAAPHVVPIDPDHACAAPAPMPDHLETTD